MQVSPFVLVTSLVSQLIVTWAYKHPNIKWVNKNTVKTISAVLASGTAIATAWASGSLDQATVQNFIEVVVNALLGSGLSVGYYEWTKVEPSLADSSTEDPTG